MSTAKVTPPRHKKLPAILLGVAVILIVSALGVGRYLFSSFHKTKEQVTKVATTSSQSAATVKNLQTQLDSLQKQLSHQQSKIVELEQELLNHSSSTPPKPIEWQPLALEYLIKMADLTLSVTGNLQTTIELLNRAKKYTTPATLAIKNALDKDIASLKAAPTVAMASIILKIETIQQHLATLPLLAPQPTPTTTKQSAQPAATTVKRFSLAVLAALKDIVIVRHHTTAPILPPDKTAILRLIVQTKLLAAELAAIQKQTTLYQHYLAQVGELITNYFATDNMVATNILNTLTELRTIQLDPPLPKLTESLGALSTLPPLTQPPPAKPKAHKRSFSKVELL